MRNVLTRSVIACVCVGGALPSGSGSSKYQERPAYLGFDRNEYPGDENLEALRKIFSYSGYWLNNPPGSKSNSWTGKRKILQAAGFGFLAVFTGRTYSQIKKAGDASQLGTSDATAAVLAARFEGFPSQTIISLTRKKAGACFRNNAPTFMHGLMELIPPSIERVSIVQEFRRRKVPGPLWLLPRIFKNTPAEGNWIIGFSTMPVRHRQDVHSRKSRRRRRLAASRLRTSGNLHSHRDGVILPGIVLRITAATGTAIPQDLIQRNTCRLTSTWPARQILLMAERAIEVERRSRNEELFRSLISRIGNCGTWGVST